MSIIETSGKDYFARKFAGTVFLDAEGEPCVIPSGELAGLSANTFTQDGRVRVLKLRGTPDKSSKAEHIIDADYFDSMEKFAVPELGWRTAAAGRVLVYFARSTRTYKKGICLDSVTYDFAPHTLELMNSGSLSMDYYARPAVKGHMILSPQVLTLAEGLRGMNSGELMSFAISPQVAVAPALDGSDGTYSVYHKLDIVGTLTSRGRVTLINNLPLEEFT